MAYLRSWGYETDRSITAHQENRLNELVDLYHSVQSHNYVDELDITESTVNKSNPFSELTVEEANRVAAHLNVRIALYTHFTAELPKEPMSFPQEVAWLTETPQRLLLERVVARAGWDTGEFFFPAHPLDQRSL